MIQSGAGIIFYRIYIFICFLTLLSIFVLYVFFFFFFVCGFGYDVLFCTGI